MNDEVRTLVTYRLQRSAEALDAARLLWEAQQYESAVNRLYYACFYAVSALLLAHGLTAAKHSGVRSLFSQHFVRTKQVPQAGADLYSNLYRFREKSDYEDLFRVDPAHVANWLAEAQQFIAHLTQLILETEADC